MTVPEYVLGLTLAVVALLAEGIVRLLLPDDASTDELRDVASDAAFRVAALGVGLEIAIVGLTTGGALFLKISSIVFLLFLGVVGRRTLGLTFRMPLGPVGGFKLPTPGRVLQLWLGVNVLVMLLQSRVS